MSDFRNYLDYPRNFLSSNNYVNRNDSISKSTKTASIETMTKEDSTTNQSSFAEVMAELGSSGSSFDTKI
ncbi:hypothetical protein [Lachnospira multipara]|uniref:hypothetical protein n=1 Tax=Lachnospira multipara TaxID=28051 RepID=UPI0004818AD8|nr:hypothetical protein [Lachnospira multipara]